MQNTSTQPKGTETPEVFILDCGHTPSPHSDSTTGFGVTSDGKKHCYTCCADNDKKAMRETGRATLYLVGNKDEYLVTNWPASLVIHPFRVRQGRHNITGKRYDVWFTFENQPWHGVTYGDNTQICHCRRIKP